MIIQLDDAGLFWEFAPLTLTRPVGNLRVGIMTTDERWNKLTGADISYKTEEYLSNKFASEAGDIIVNASIIADENLAKAVIELQENTVLVSGDIEIARRGEVNQTVFYEGDVMKLSKRWHIYQLNGEAIEIDYRILTQGRTGVQLSSTNMILGDSTRVFLEEGAKVEGVTLNTSGGPIYVGANAEIMEGSVVRGPLAMCESSALKLSAKVYGPTTLGPHCKVGGEVNNVVFYGYSNKGHDGFLGNSVVGEWCNLGADTNTSNLKNNYGLVKTYSYASRGLEQTDVQFMGLVMGDHSKCGINTMFNTATTVGVSANVFGASFPEKYVPSFSWGETGERFDFDRALVAANNMMVRRRKELSDDDVAILRHIFDQ